MLSCRSENEIDLCADTPPIPLIQPDDLPDLHDTTQESLQDQYPMHAIPVIQPDDLLLEVNERQEDGPQEESDNPVSDASVVERPKSAVEVGEGYASICVANRLSRKAAQEIWAYMTLHQEELGYGSIPHYRTLQRKLFARMTVTITMDMVHRDSATGIAKTETNLFKYPVKFYRDNPIFRREWVITKCCLRRTVQFHLDHHPGTGPDDWRNVMLSDDGVPESKSTAVSFDVISLKFIG